MKRTELTVGGTYRWSRGERSNPHLDAVIIITSLNGTRERRKDYTANSVQALYVTKDGSTQGQWADDRPFNVPLRQVISEWTHEERDAEIEDVKAAAEARNLAYENTRVRGSILQKRFDALGLSTYVHVQYGAMKASFNEDDLNRILAALEQSSLTTTH